MKKLRKVVKLRIEDLYGRDMYFKLKKEKSNNISYHYVWNNRYFIGDTEVLRSRSYDNFDKKPLFCRTCDDYYLEDFLLHFFPDIDMNALKLKHKENIAKENKELYMKNIFRIKQLGINVINYKNILDEMFGVKY